MPPKKPNKKVSVNWQELKEQKRQEHKEQQRSDRLSADYREVLAEYMYLYSQPINSLNRLSYEDLVYLVSKGRKFKMIEQLKMFEMTRLAQGDNKKIKKIISDYENDIKAL